MPATDANDGADGEADWDDLAFVKSSQYREAVVETLKEGEGTPSDIAEDTEMGIAHISRSLQGLRDEGVVELLVSDDTRKGRYYGLTAKGDDLAGQLEEVR